MLTLPNVGGSRTEWSETGTDPVGQQTDEGPFLPPQVNKVRTMRGPCFYIQTKNQLFSPEPTGFMLFGPSLTLQDLWSSSHRSRVRLSLNCVCV